MQNHLSLLLSNGLTFDLMPMKLKSDCCLFKSHKCTERPSTCIWALSPWHKKRNLRNTFADKRVIWLLGRSYLRGGVVQVFGACPWACVYLIVSFTYFPLSHRLSLVNLPSSFVSLSLSWLSAIVCISYPIAHSFWWPSASSRRHVLTYLHKIIFLFDFGFIFLSLLSM